MLEFSTTLVQKEGIVTSFKSFKTKTLNHLVNTAIWWLVYSSSLKQSFLLAVSYYDTLHTVGYFTQLYCYEVHCIYFCGRHCRYTEVALSLKIR